MGSGESVSCEGGVDGVVSSGVAGVVGELVCVEARFESWEGAP